MAGVLQLACHFNARAKGVHVSPAVFDKLFAQFPIIFKPSLSPPFIYSTQQWLENYALPKKSAQVLLLDSKHKNLVRGGPEWVLLTEKFPSQYNLWRRSTISRIDDKVFTIVYEADEGLVTFVDEIDDVSKLKQELHNILLNLIKLAKQYKVDNFAVTFDRAMKCLDSNHPENEWPGLSQQNRQLLNASICASSVRGGMGSWNDNYFADSNIEEYEKWTKLLYDCLDKCFQASINSTGR